MDGDDETPWYRSLLVGVGALLGVAVVVGALISAVALGAVSVSGLGEQSATVEEEPSLFIPSYSPTPEGDDPGLTLEDINPEAEQPEAAGQESEDGSARSEAPKKKRKPKARSVISLSASPLEVSRMERIYLTGTYPGGEGASLQVQRFEGGWTDFPTSASVSGGTFNTYVMTGRVGVNKFRVVDRATGKSSNPVTIRVG